MAKQKKHKVGDVWKIRTNPRKKGKPGRTMIVKKVAKGKYKMRVASPKNKSVNVSRSWAMDRKYPYTNKQEKWEAG